MRSEYGTKNQIKWTLFSAILRSENSGIECELQKLVHSLPQTRQTKTRNRQNPTQHDILNIDNSYGLLCNIVVVEQILK